MLNSESKGVFFLTIFNQLLTRETLQFLHFCIPKTFI